MKSILFVRHGQSVANAGGVTMAHHAIPLSTLGKSQAQALAELLPKQPARIYVSAYLRAQETAQPFCERVAMQAVIHPLLHEFSSIDPALIDGMTGEQRRPIADAYWQEADPDKRMGKNAETFNEFDQRVAAFIPELQGLPDGSVMFGHGIWIAMMVWKMLGFAARDSSGMQSFRRFLMGLPLPNGAVYCLREAAPSQWHVKAEESIMRKVIIDAPLLSQLVRE